MKERALVTMENNECTINVGSTDKAHTVVDLCDSYCKPNTTRSTINNDDVTTSKRNKKTSKLINENGDANSKEKKSVEVTLSTMKSNECDIIVESTDKPTAVVDLGKSCSNKNQPNIATNSIMGHDNSTKNKSYIETNVDSDKKKNGTNLLTTELSECNINVELTHPLIPIMDLSESVSNENQLNISTHLINTNDNMTTDIIDVGISVLNSKDVVNSRENIASDSSFYFFDCEDDIFVETKEDFQEVPNRCQQPIETSHSDEDKSELDNSVVQVLSNVVVNMLLDEGKVSLGGQPEEVKQESCDALESDERMEIVLERGAQCEGNVSDSILGTSEKLIVYLEQENLLKLKETHTETKYRDKKKWRKWNSNQAADFVCKQCPFTASTRYNFLVHQAEAHKKLSIKKMDVPLRYVHPTKYPDKVLYKCTDCLYRTDLKSTFNNHLLIHKSLDEVEVLRCALCPYITKIKGNLISHMKVHAFGDRVKVKKCPYCSFRTKNQWYMPKHISMVHDFVKVKMWKCPHCAFQSKYQKSLISHLDTHSKKRKLYKCPLCPFETPHKSVLSFSHRLKHTSDEARVYSCAHCDYKSKTRDTLIRHLLTHRVRNINWHKCKYCPYRTKHKDYLTHHVHVHEIPEGVRPYPCKHCPYMGKTAHHLYSHAKKHLPPDVGAMYRCPECPYHSRNSANVKRHQLVHRKGSEVAWVRCKFCEYEAKSEDRLKLHFNNVHKDPEDVKWHECGECSFRTKSKGNLNRHLVIHSDPNLSKQFRCERCGKCTKSKKSFDKHLARHPENYLKCDKCNYKTMFSELLNRHQKQRH